MGLMERPEICPIFEFVLGGEGDIPPERRLSLDQYEIDLEAVSVSIEGNHFVIDPKKITERTSDQMLITAFVLTATSKYSKRITI